MEAVALDGLAAADDALGLHDEALKHYARALDLYAVSGYKREEAHTLNNVGRIEERGGDVETAVGHYRRALALSRETHDRFVESQSLLNLARVARASGDLDEARRHAEDALGLVEELRENVASYSLRASYFASVHELHEFYVDLLMELDRKRPSEAFDVLAFRASEKARARSLLEMLSEGPADPRDMDPELLEREKKLEQDIRAHAGSGELRSGRAAGGKSPTGSSADLSELLAELDRVRAVIRSQSEHDQALETEPVSIEELQRTLDASTLLISYFLGPEHSYVWALTRSNFSVHALPPQEEIETQVQRLYRLLAARERKEGETAKAFHHRSRESDRAFWESAMPLSRTLLGPVAGELEGKRLVIIGDGALHHFPFSALPIPNSTDQLDPLPLIAEHEIVRLPSASILVALRTRDIARPEPPKTLAVLADPVFDREDPRVEKQVSEESVAPEFTPFASARALTRALADVPLGEGGAIPRLLASRQEAQDILSMVPPEESLVALGFEASRALATSGELTQYRVVHFATHGLLDTEHPELSGIILSLIDENGEPRDGFLRLHDIETLHLPVNLVVLSACSTGLGKEVKGEGMIGLVRGFMSAGADRVLASYWNVDDEATAELMKRFYRNHFTKGLAPSAALREAQRSMWMEKRWRSPFYWAAFELQGQWQ
jgi:CHAT domain-containing protein